LSAYSHVKGGEEERGGMMGGSWRRQEGWEGEERTGE